MSNESQSAAGERTRKATVSIADALIALVSRGLQRTGRGDVPLTGLLTMASLERGGPRKITDLASMQKMSQPSMSVLVKSLVAAHMVERRVDPSDARVALVAITPIGAAYLDGRRRAWMTEYEDVLEQLSSDHLEALEKAVPALARVNQLIADRRDTSGRNRIGAVWSGDDESSWRSNHPAAMSAVPN